MLYKKTSSPQYFPRNPSIWPSLQDMRAPLSAMGFLVFVFALPACHMLPHYVPSQGTSESECVNCHTNAPRLATLAQEIEKVRPRPGPSPESTGEC